MTTTSKATIAGSFRDPSGFLFFQNNTLYRQVNISYRDDYDQLVQSGLYKHLVEKGFLISHEEINPSSFETSAYKILQPEKIPFISYPYEWSFSQLKDAALLTLTIQQTALKYGMSLKDASAYNIQFYLGKPVFIDTLSFEKYSEGKPWVAYRQFCKHFLAPLALMAFRDYRLIQLLRTNIDGIPLELAAMLLPPKTKWMLSLAMHIHWHAKSQIRYADKKVTKQQRPISKMQFLGLIDNLKSAVKKLKWNPMGTEWADYYENTNYTDDAIKLKADMVSDYLDAAAPQTVWDLGANNGHFSRIANQKGCTTISFDIDPCAVEKNYRLVKKGLGTLLPLVLDLTNPSPAIGWNNTERESLIERGPADCAMALALIHHLAISNNVPFEKIAAYFAEICSHLIIEFVPKKDSQVQRLLATREDIFPNYHKEAFEQEFAQYFELQKSQPITGTDRYLYLFSKK